MKKIKAILMIMTCGLALPLASCVSSGEVLLTGTVNIKTMTNGTVTSDIASGNVADIVTLTVTPNEGYYLYTLNVNGTSIVDDVVNNKVTFKLVGGENNVTGTFKAGVVSTAAIVVVDTMENGVVTSSLASGKANDITTLTITPNEGYKIYTLAVNGTSIVNNVKNNSVTYTLKSGENRVTGSFKAIGDATSSTEKLTKDKLNFTNTNLGVASETYYTPSVGSPNILVVPVQFSDISSKRTATRLQNLGYALNGSNADGTTDYWESLASFYKKSSYGALTPNYVVTDTVIPQMTGETFKSKTDDYGTESLTLIDEIYSKIAVNGVKISSNISQYDSDNDNLIDGIWFIYNEFDLNNVDSDAYWAYTYWYYAYNDERPGSEELNIPVSTYANMAAAFNYEDNSYGLDSHTLIHESGHMFGLEDYYSYDSSVNYSATGGMDMMDMNIGEHNTFSKLSYGWVEPTVVTGDSGSITLKPFESSGDCLIVPSSYFNDSAFGEYLIFEYYTPTGLNYLDSHTKYATRNLYYSQSGVRVFHVDARLMENAYSNTTDERKKSGKFLNESATSIPSSQTSYYSFAFSNTASSSYNKSNYLLSTVDAQNRIIYNKRNADNNSLFKAGSAINKTTISNFLKSGKFNDGTSFDYNISIDSIDEKGATITFVK